jgi:hypothetical protein
MGLGFVYILNNAAYEGVVKIGCTEKSPEERARQLSGTGVLFPFVVVHAVKLFYFEEAEREIHRRLEPFRCNLRREFFRISVRDAIRVVDEVAAEYRAREPVGVARFPSQAYAENNLDFSAGDRGREQKKPSLFPFVAGCLAVTVVLPLMVFGGLVLAVVVIGCGLSRNGGSPDQASSRSTVKPPAKHPKEVQGEVAEQKRKEEEARKAKEQAEAKAKAEAEQKRKDDEARKALMQAEAERLDVEMVLYELAKADYHAAARVKVAVRFLDDARKEVLSGRVRESERLVKSARERLQEVLDLYPDAEAAGDAKQILDGKDVPARPLPLRPVLPKGVSARDDELAVTVKSLPKPDLPPDTPPIPVPGKSSRPVYVRGYTRPDGVYVQPHYRAVVGKERREKDT